MPLLTASEMRAAESGAVASGTPAFELMARAATGAATAILQSAPKHPALVLCGPGNNGGDGYGVAAYLQAAGLAVRVAANAPPVAEPAAHFAARWTGPVEPLARAEPAPLIIDALFGTGLKRPLTADFQGAIDRLRGTGVFCVALDLPSGIDADSGAALGEPLSADLTIAFGAAKRGHLLGVGRHTTGRLLVVDIGIAISAAAARLVAPPVLQGLSDDTHKYARGGLLVIAGAHPGAARLAALAALRSGAGAVTLVGPGVTAPADAVMLADDSVARALLDTGKVRAIAIGPGLTDCQRSRDWLGRLLERRVPLVIDAGALALLDGPQRLLTETSASLVLTPHDGEFVRAFGAIGSDRVAAAGRAAVAANAVVVLKGRLTIIAAPDGRMAINDHATPWLATAGAGDVLSGIIAALLAQGLAPFDAAQIGVWLHGDAGLRCGPGLIADDLVAQLPAVLAGL